MKTVRRLRLVDDKLCTKCGGACCKRLPGAAEPKDFGAPSKRALVKNLRAALETGHWCFDWWEGDPRPGKARSGEEKLSRAYFVRPAIVDHVGERFHPAWEGTCSLLTKTGCPLPYKGRPVACRGLKPVPSLDCKASYGDKRDVAIAWIPYLDLLRESGLLDGAEDVETDMFDMFSMLGLPGMGR